MATSSGVRLKGRSVHFFAGLKIFPSIGFGVTPYALVLGVLSLEAGYDAWQIMLHSATVYAGIAQITLLTLTENGAPAWVALISAIMVNLRLLLYSFSFSFHMHELSQPTRAFMAFLLTDQAYAVTVSYDQRHKVNVHEKAAYFFGFSIAFYLLWVIATVMGNLLGRTIPEELDFFFALPLVFVSLLIGFINTQPRLTSCIVAGVFSLLLHPLPNNLGFLIAIFLGIGAGVLADAIQGKFKVS